jgi:hypothetical protein
VPLLCHTIEDDVFGTSARVASKCRKYQEITAGSW